MSEEPFQPPAKSKKPPHNQVQSVSSDRAIYNIVSDTATGVNIRWSDNKFQAVFVIVSVLLASVVGAIVTVLNSSWDFPWYGGALVGAFAGLVVGLFASGVILMIYRTARHIKGKHD